jgi:hypothetical protein
MEMNGLRPSSHDSGRTNLIGDVYRQVADIFGVDIGRICVDSGHHEI